jgi:hypothetical protein
MRVTALDDSRSTLGEDRCAQGLQHRVMAMTEHHEVGVLVAAALVSWDDVMNVEDRGAFSAEEAAATAGVARKDARSDLFPSLHL